MFTRVGGDLLNVHGETGNIDLGGDLLNVHGQAARRRGFTKCIIFDSVI